AGTRRQAPSPINAVLGVTRASVTFAIKTLLPPELPLNDGFDRTIVVTAPEGTIVNPVKPAAVAAGNLETSQRVVDVIYKALSAALPSKIPAASHGSMNNLMLGGVDPKLGRSWAFYETIGGGQGARPGGLRGGSPGKPSEYLVRRSDGRSEVLGAKDSTTLRPGDTLIIRTAGGGGIGQRKARSKKG